VVEIPCADIVNVEVGGRGRIGDGVHERERFAFQRAIDEMAATTVVKSLIGRTRMDTSIHIETTKGEGYFHCDSATPDEVRQPIARFLAALPRDRKGQRAEHVHLSGELVKLTDLRTRGLLTEAEFESAVAAVLDGER
jgi:hypothetical protein